MTSRKPYVKLTVIYPRVNRPFTEPFHTSRRRGALEALSARRHTVKIGISINGEGRGHFSRALALAEQLQTRYELAFWVPAHLAGELSELFPGTEISVLPHYRFVQRGFTLDWAATVSANAGILLASGKTISAIAREMRDAGLDAVLSDFEPFASRAAKRLGIPVVQLNHPSVVERTRERDPANVIEWLAACAVSRYMTAFADRKIVCSFFDGDVGPIIRRSLRERRITRGDYIVAYAKTGYRDALEPVISALGKENFRVFPDPTGDYDESLAGCRALVAAAGHQAISEALALGKPVFAIPVSGQYEQILNARKLHHSGFGDWSTIDGIDEALPRFIANLERYERAIATSRSFVRKRGFRCEDETLRAACMVESFILERGRKTARRRVRGALETVSDYR